MPRRLPLTGITVVSFEQAIAAPLCSRHLGDLGARVVKVENRSIGDFTRTYDDVVHGQAAHFVWLNRNKESFAVDVKHPGGAEAVDRLLAQADVVIQNWAPGAAARLGLDAESIVRRHPRAVAVDMSGYGTGGPYDAKRAYDVLVQSEAGSCAITGYPGQPAKAGVPVADVGAGLYAMTSILAALFDRTGTGRGIAIEISMLDAVAEWMGFAYNYTRFTGEERPPNGVSSPMVAPYGAYPTADGQTVVLGTTNDAEWRRLASKLIGRADLAEDPRYGDNASRCAHRAEIDAEISAWTQQHPLAAIRARADDAGIGNARLNSVGDAVAHPQLAARNRWQDVATPGGPVPSLLPPMCSPEWAPRMDPVPALGEHNEAILAELGYDDAAIARLRAEGVA